MKKLMIVAAVAVLAGVAKAVPSAPSAGLWYDATFTLKTTVGKANSTTTTYNLGKAGTIFWYQDPSLQPSKFVLNASGYVTNIVDTTNFVFKTVKGVKVPTLTKAGLANSTLLDALAVLSFTYSDKSAGTYCLSFKYKANVCYRVAGTIKVSGSFWDDECLKTTLVGGAPSTLTTSFVDAFGAYTLIDANGKIKSNKVELYADDVATVVNSLQKYSKKNGWEPVDVLDSNKGDRTINVLSVAGHGTYGYVYDDTNDKVDWPGVTAVSGSAVGTADLPECVSCCAPNTPTSPFDCCGYTSTETAVFGTFTIKYNNSLTKSDLY